MEAQEGHVTCPRSSPVCGEVRILTERAISHPLLPPVRDMAITSNICVMILSLQTGLVGFFPFKLALLRMTL